MALGDVIRERRRRQGWSQADLADRVGVTRETISKWETGRLVPDVPEPFNTLCTALGLSAEMALREIGVQLAPPRAASLPRELVDRLLALTDDQRAALLLLIRAATESPR